MKKIFVCNNSIPPPPLGTYNKPGPVEMGGVGIPYFSLVYRRQTERLELNPLVEFSPHVVYYELEAPGRKLTCIEMIKRKEEKMD